jgi:hypothetical protein
MLLQWAALSRNSWQGVPKQRKADRNARAFEFGIILDAGAQFAQAGQDLRASIPDAGDKTEAGNDYASRWGKSLRGHLRGKSSEVGPFCIRSTIRQASAGIRSLVDFR